jgi:hypothetical protein
MPTGVQKGRGAISNRTGRFEALAVEAVDDGWGIADEPLPPLETTVQPEPAHSVITRNNSPDIPFEAGQSSPYRGCENGCSLLGYARPSHQYLGFSAGLDFETKLFYKKNAAHRVCARSSASVPSKSRSPINLGANTDPYRRWSMQARRHRVRSSKCARRRAITRCHDRDQGFAIVVATSTCFQEALQRNDSVKAVCRV